VNPDPDLGFKDGKQIKFAIEAQKFNFVSKHAPYIF